MTAVSLFTGAGGLDIGIERSGFCVIAAHDIEPSCYRSLVHNQGRRIKIGATQRTYLADARILQADARDLRGANFADQRVDLVFGGPPCQAFSSAGRMLSVLDPRGALIREYVRLAAELQPRAILFENVRGLVTARDEHGEPGGVLKHLMDALHDVGYSCRVDLLNSADYGAYQRRVRCFIVGIRGGVAPEFPAATHEKVFSNGDQQRLFSERELLPWKTLGEFLDQFADSDEEAWVRPSEALGAQLAVLPDGSGVRSVGVVEATRPGGHWGYRQGTFIADKRLPARTVTGSASQDWIRLRDGSLRRLTLREVAGLQGFPSEWEFLGTQAEQFRQVGNAVPTILAEVLGRVIRGELLNKGEAVQNAVKLEIPVRLLEYIAYTKRENARNGPSRSEGVRPLCGS